MKKSKRILSILIFVVFLAILSVIIYKSPQYTSFVIKGQQKQVQFYFFDENNCSLNGYLFNGNRLIGKTENGIFNLTYDYYREKVDLREDISLFGELANCSSHDLYFDKSWKGFEIPEYYFLGDSIFRFKTQINPNNPSRRELLGFINPDSVKEELSQISLNQKDTLEDLSSINMYLHKKVKYADDWNFSEEENYWQTAQETLSLKRGDCEDYSTALLSMFLAYNSSLNCYNLIFSSHVATLCYIGEYYIYYDQEKTELRKEIKSSTKETIPLLMNLKKEYLEHYGLGENERVYYAFNNYRFIEFDTDDEFIIWQSALYRTKEQKEIFEEMENELSGMNITYPEPEEEIIELSNAPAQQMPSLKGFINEYLYVLILLVIISIFLVTILIWINIKK